LFAAVQISDTW